MLFSPQSVSSLGSILPYFRRSANRRCWLSDRLQETAGAGGLHSFCLCFYSLSFYVLFFIYSLIYLFIFCVCVISTGESSCLLDFNSLRPRLRTRHHIIVDDSVFVYLLTVSVALLCRYAFQTTIVLSVAI